ncbi:MAG: CBS domain-containing protein [Rhodospirillales bacterium]|nr:CBS domain-containing protein [Alphaproteobacteria bacterium]USO03696.1 MAG: CBS domain-containing protein [Rhodospirillales bacterium]
MTQSDAKLPSGTKSPRIQDCFNLSINDRAITEKETIQVAVERMQKEKISCFLVRDSQGKGVGVLSEQEIVNALFDKGDESSKALVSDYMAIETHVVMEYDTLDDAIEVMSKQNMSSIPVISESGYVSGFVSRQEVITEKIIKEEKEKTA